MKRKIEIITEEQLANCINSNSSVEIWLGDNLEEVSVLLDFDENTIRVTDGCYFRKNISIYLIGNYFTLS